MPSPFQHLADTRGDLLSHERWYTQTKRGYARGWEPVRYVENVQAYLNILQVAGMSANAAVAPPDPDIREP